MAQPISNTTQGVKWGLNLPKTSLPYPSFNTANSTPAVLNKPVPLANTPTTVNKPNVATKQPTNTTSYGTTTPQQATQPVNQGTNPNLNNLITGLTSLGTGLQNYADSQKKGLIAPPTSQPVGTFGNFVTGLQEAGKPSKTQSDYLKKVEKASQQGTQVGQEARKISDMYGKEIARVGELGAGGVAGAKSTGTQPIGAGNAAIAAESASNRIAALSAAQVAALQGTGQQLTASEQGLTGMTSALQGANTQQQLAQTALTSGGQLAIPSPAAYGQTVFDPTTGTYTGAGGNLDPQVQAQQLAQQIMSGRMTYDQAISSLSYAGQAGTNFLNNAITAAGGNALQLQATGAGQQANVATQTTAGTEIARQGLATATQDYVNMNTASQYAHQQAGAVSNILASAGLNSVSSTDYNKALNNLKGRFSDVNYASLQASLIEAQAAYSSLLSLGGGTPSGREEQALSTLNINQSAAAINASIQELESAVARRLQAQYGALQQYNTNLGTGGTLGGSTGSGGLYDW